MIYRASGYRASVNCLFGVMVLFGVVGALAGNGVVDRVFWAVSAVVAALAFLGIRRSATIRTTADAVVCGSLWRGRSIPWDTIAAFAVASSPSAAGVPRQVVAVHLRKGGTVTLKDFAVMGSHSMRIAGIVEELNAELDRRRLLSQRG